MFNPALLDEDIQKFIRNFDSDIHRLALSGSPFQKVSVQDLIQQIESRNRIKNKLPLWFETENILYPPILNLEQTSSEITARYKASLISGKTLADITGGFGVDAFYFSRSVDQVAHFEWNEPLSELANHNFKQLGADNIECHSQSGMDAIKNREFDIIYADPSRRHESKGKIFFLNDCEPNIPENFDFLLKQTEILLLKTSPMLDISVGLNELKNKVSEIHIVAVDNEVKELLWLIRKESNSEKLKIYTVNFARETIQQFHFEYDSHPEATYSDPKNYLYEPNVALMKSGGFGALSQQLQLPKLHPHSHLFTSSDLTDFPGRRFKIEKIIPYQKSILKKELTLPKANVTTRNFPESVARLREKWKIKDGGDTYLFFTTLQNEQKVVLVCEKV